MPKKKTRASSSARAFGPFLDILTMLEKSAYGLALQYMPFPVYMGGSTYLWFPPFSSTCCWPNYQEFHCSRSKHSRDGEKMKLTCSIDAKLLYCSRFSKNITYNQRKSDLYYTLQCRTAYNFASLINLFSIKYQISPFAILVFDDILFHIEMSYRLSVVLNPCDKAWTAESQIANCLG